MKYIDADRLKAEIERQLKLDTEYGSNVYDVCSELLSFITSLQQEQPIEGKQVVIVTETDGDANIHWDCRSLDDVKALLASAQSFIADKQVEELRGQGSGPDYNTTEGRFRNAHKFQQEQPEFPNGKFVFPKYLYARTKDNKTLDVSYAPQDMTAIEYVRNDLIEQEHSQVADASKMDLEVDLVTEYDEQFDSDPVYGKLANRNAGIAIAHHFYELGLNARKEE